MDQNSRGRTRTCDPTVNSRLLYQLSYAGKEHRTREMYAAQILIFATDDFEVNAHSGAGSADDFRRTGQPRDEAQR